MYKQYTAVVHVFTVVHLCFTSDLTTEDNLSPGARLPDYVFTQMNIIFYIRGIQVLR